MPVTAIVGGIAPITIVPVATAGSSANIPGGTTFSNLDIGPYVKDRYLAFGVSFTSNRLPTPRTVSGVTVDGASMTELGRQRARASNIAYEALLFGIDAGEGSALEGETTADFAVGVNAGDGAQRYGVHTFNVLGGQRPLVIAADQGFDSSGGTSQNFDVTLTAGGGLITIAGFAGNSGSDPAWVNVAEHGNFFQGASTFSHALWALSGYRSKTLPGILNVTLNAPGGMGLRAVSAVAFARKA